MGSRHVSAILCCCLLLALSECKSWDDLERERERQRERAGEEISVNVELAARIIQVVDNYEQIHGEFPAELDVLVPEHLSEIPKTTRGHDFTYERDDRFGQGYYLCFDVSVEQEPGCCYHRRLQIWDCSGECE